MGTGLEHIAGGEFSIESYAGAGDSGDEVAGYRRVADIVAKLLDLTLLDAIFRFYARIGVEAEVCSKPRFEILAKTVLEDYRDEP